MYMYTSLKKIMNKHLIHLRISFILMLLFCLSVFVLPVIYSNNMQIRISFALLGLLFIPLVIIIYFRSSYRLRKLIKEIDDDVKEKYSGGLEDGCDGF